MNGARALRRGRIAALAALLLFASASPTAPAWGQVDQSRFEPPVQQVDSRGVDLINGSARVSIPLVRFGNDATALDASIELSVPGPVGPHLSSDFVRTAGGTLGQMLRPRAETVHVFVEEMGNLTNVIFPQGSGYYRTHPGYDHNNPDGTQYSTSVGPAHFMRLTTSDPNRAGVYNAAGDRGVYGSPLLVNGAPPWNRDIFDKIVLASGEEWTFYRQRTTVADSIPGHTREVARLRFVVSSRGYGIQFLYMSDTLPTTTANVGNWIAPHKITGYNKAEVHCNESLLQECVAVSGLPSAELTYNVTAGTVIIKEPGAAEGIELTFARQGTIWQANVTSTRHTAVTNSTVSYLLGTSNSGEQFVQRVTDADGQWNYTHIVYDDDSGYIPYVAATATNPAGGVTEATGHSLFGQLTSFMDATLSRTEVSVWTRGGDYRVYGYNFPQFDSLAFLRDVRNNITEAVRNPVPNSGGSPIQVLTAVYPADCVNPRTCNLPLSVTDANNNTTDYTYAPEHGGVVTQTGPSVPTRQSNNTVLNVRPQTRYEYVQRTARISDGSSGTVAAGPPVWLLAATSTCRTSAATGNPSAPCTASNDEIRTSYDYGPTSGVNNLLLRGVTVTGAGGLVQRSCYGYDSRGRRISGTGPGAALGSCP